MLSLVCLTATLGVAVRGEERPAGGGVVYVNNLTGSDEFTGASAEPGADKAGPFATIMQAVRKCNVGARIEIANTGSDYRESVEIEKFAKGRPDAPLVIDGHGAYVTGLVAVPTDQWLHLRDDIYYFLNKVGDASFQPRGWYDRKIGDAVYGVMPNSNWLGFTKHSGWFTEKEAPEIFILNGKPGPNVLTLEEIPPGGFFYDAQAAVIKEPAGQRCLFFRLPEGKTLADCTVELPLHRGIYVSDDYVTVCNIGSRYSQDDGFAGFWGQNVVLRNIHACFNCDQGVSFHGNSSTLIDGALIERNGGCGIVDVMSCSTIYRNATVRDNYPGGVLFQGFSHAMYGCRILGNRGTQIEAGKSAAVSLGNCLIIGSGPETGGNAVRMEFGRLDHCTILNSPVGVAVTVGGSVRNSIISNCPIVVSVDKNAQGKFFLDKTILALGKATFGEQKVDDTGWADFMGTFKGAAGAIIDHPVLEEPLYLLPNDSPHLKAGENGSTPGAHLSPFKEWMAKE